MSTAWVVAGITFIGVVGSLAFNVTSGHEANRRSDRERSFEAVSELVASYRLLMQSRSFPHGNPPAPQSSAAGPEEILRYGDAWARFDAAYAKLSLVARDTRPAIEALHSDVVTARGCRSDSEIQDVVAAFISNIEPKLRFPVLVFLNQIQRALTTRHR